MKTTRTVSLSEARARFAPGVRGVERFDDGDRRRMFIKAYDPREVSTGVTEVAWSELDERSRYVVAARLGYALGEPRRDNVGVSDPNAPAEVGAPAGATASRPLVLRPAGDDIVVVPAGWVRTGGVRVRREAHI